MNKTLLFDTDIVVYRAAFACESRHHYFVTKDGLNISFGHSTQKEVKEKLKEMGHSKDTGQIYRKMIYKDLPLAYHYADLIIKNTISEVGGGTVQHHLTSTDKSNFRYKIATLEPYKGTRKEKPKYYEEVRNYIIEKYAPQIVSGKETDDELARKQWDDFKEHNGDQDICKTVVCTIDKDAMTYPGWKYNFVKKELTWVSEHEADFNFYTQLIIGDKGDDIPGIKYFTKKRIGIKTAHSLLKNCKTEYDMWTQVKNLYVYNCKPEDQDKFLDRVTEIGNLLWMQREEGLKWEPPKKRSSK